MKTHLFVGDKPQRYCRAGACPPQAKACDYQLQKEKITFDITNEKKGGLYEKKYF